MKVEIVPKKVHLGEWFFLEEDIQMTVCELLIVWKIQPKVFDVGAECFFVERYGSMYVCVVIQMWTGQPEKFHVGIGYLSEGDE